MVKGYGRKARTKLSTCRFPEEVTDLLARRIRKMPAYKDCRVEDMGPFGLGCRCILSVKKNDKLIGFLEVKDGPYGKGFSYVDYNAPKTNAFPKDSIGDINGFNDATLPLPSDIDEVLKLVFTPEK